MIHQIKIMPSCAVFTLLHLSKQNEKFDFISLLLFLSPKTKFVFITRKLWPSGLVIKGEGDTLKQWCIYMEGWLPLMTGVWQDLATCVVVHFRLSMYKWLYYWWWSMQPVTLISSFIHVFSFKEMKTLIKKNSLTEFFSVLLLLHFM